MIKVLKSLFITVFYLFALLYADNSFAKHRHNKHKKAKNSRIHFIGPWYGGFFASFNCVLNHLSWCEKNNLTPIVYWDYRSLYYVSYGFNNSYNAWEYYFQPIASVNYKPSTSIAMTFTPTTSFEFCQDYMDDTTRQKAYHLIGKYIKLQPTVQQKIDGFYQNYIQGKNTIGIHLRGTDKYLEENLIDTATMVRTALQYADETTQFFIATDEHRLLNEMIALLQGHKVIYYNCGRSSNGQPLHYAHNAQAGEDVLVEASLLARCNLLIHTMSNVSTAPLYFNPSLKHVLVRRSGTVTFF